MKNEIFEIKDGAIFVADAHENANRRGFLRLLEAIEGGQIEASQLFLMGDIFDFISGYTQGCAKFYAQHLAKIAKISQHTEIFYIEGNHDFKMRRLLSSARVFEISAQPVRFFIRTANGKKSIQIAHGDKFLPFFSKIALLFLRTRPFLWLSNLLDKICGYRISDALLKRLSKKRLDYKIPNFRGLIEKKMGHYDADIVIEGHYHQGEILNFGQKIYINLPSFASHQRYFIVKCQDNEVKFLQKNLKGH